MSTQILVVKNDKVAEVSARAKTRGATKIEPEKLNGTTRLTITYPPLDEVTDAGT